MWSVIGVVRSTNSVMLCPGTSHFLLEGGSDFNQIQPHSLEILYLNDNQIKSIQITANDMFPNLRFLRIERNSIDNWNSLNELNKLPNLTKLRCKENPIFKGNKNNTVYVVKRFSGVTRQWNLDLDKELEGAQIAGRIKNLSNVNGNTVSCISCFFGQHGLRLNKLYVSLADQ